MTNLELFKKSGNIPMFTYVLHDEGNMLAVIQNPDNEGKDFIFEIQYTKSDEYKDCFTTLEDLKAFNEALTDWLKVMMS